jgi:hypothetical protein
MTSKIGTTVPMVGSKEALTSVAETLVYTDSMREGDLSAGTEVPARQESNEGAVAVSAGRAASVFACARGLHAEKLRRMLQPPSQSPPPSPSLVSGRNTHARTHACMHTHTHTHTRKAASETWGQTVVHPAEERDSCVCLCVDAYVSAIFDTRRMPFPSSAILNGCSLQHLQCIGNSLIHGACVPFERAEGRTRLHARRTLDACNASPCAVAAACVFARVCTSVGNSTRCII